MGYPAMELCDGCYHGHVYKYARRCGSLTHFDWSPTTLSFGVVPTSQCGQLHQDIYSHVRIWQIPNVSIHIDHHLLCSILHYRSIQLLQLPSLVVVYGWKQSAHHSADTCIGKSEKEITV